MTEVDLAVEKSAADWQFPPAVHVDNCRACVVVRVGGYLVAGAAFQSRPSVTLVTAN
jgi:hypothetical protein